MRTRFYMDLTGASVAVAGLLVAFLLMFVPLMMDGDFARLAKFLTPTLFALGALWLGLARGTYVTVDKGKVYGTLFFFRGKETGVSEIVSIHPRHTFGGLTTEVYMKYRKKDGAIAERGLVSKQGLKKKELKSLLDTIRSANPIIEIDSELQA